MSVSPMTNYSGENTESVQTFLANTLVVFAIKVLICFVAVLVLGGVFFHELDRRAAEFRGGEKFWNSFEERLARLADEPDLPSDRKARLIVSLKKLSERYRPYLDALGGK